MIALVEKTKMLD